MTNKQILMKEIELLSPLMVEEVYDYVTYLKFKRQPKETREIAYASEQSLAKEWLLPEEDAAWADL
ncbi:MAG TPA: DUF2281 domain-containing protein [Candidatus Aphodoplasma excrementigallinarum]|uniref:DUF2281 domain-containing protein n=1 Tax=Candidatus Aphodoplasma excrementigallinarum TaxID=2840673 RepID=A0A9D1SZU1_9FIRM|nr:DUF2281 domain-containing protein [Candidatus Aphodoplasma excrementigallinarum]